MNKRTVIISLTTIVVIVLCQWTYGKHQQSLNQTADAAWQLDVNDIINANMSVTNPCNEIKVKAKLDEMYRERVRDTHRGAKYWASQRLYQRVDRSVIINGILRSCYFD